MRWRAFMGFVGFCLGASLVLLFAIAYDTSANVAAIEGGRRHFVFGPILLYALVGGLAGMLIGQSFGRERR